MILRHQISLPLLIVSLLLPSSLTSAQQKNARPDDSAALRAKAVELLQSLATQLSSLQSAENRARIGANIADSLWSHDEKRARALFTSVMDDINLGLQNRDRDDPQDDHNRAVFQKLRFDTIERIGDHDPEMALTFLRTTELKSLSSDDQEVQHALEMRLARELTAASPDLALKLGREALARGFPPELLLVVRQLHRKHREQGVALYKETVAKLRNVNLVEDWNAADFAKTLAESLAPPVADDVAYRELMDLLITSAFTNNCNKDTPRNAKDDYCTTVALLVPQMLKVDPLRASQLKHLVTNPDAYELASLQPAYYEMEDLPAQATIDEVLALAEKQPAIANTIYWRALMMAENTERARKIATDYVKDEQTRQAMLKQIDRRDQQTQTVDQEVSDAQKAIAGMTAFQDRVAYLIFVANRIAARDRNAALKLFEQAYGFVEAAKPGKERMQFQIGMADNFCLHKSDRGLAIMESLLPKLNELVEAGAKLDGFETRYLRDGEWNMSANGETGSILTSLSERAPVFAWCDFDRAVSLAAQFERSEIRIMAQVKLAQGILGGPIRPPAPQPLFID